MDRRTKRLIEWAFKNYEANKILGAEQVRDIAESGLTASFDKIVSGSNVGNPTERKALRLQERAQQYLWAKVVENTMTAFKFEIGYDILWDKYMAKFKLGNKVLMDKYNVPERTYFRWLDRVLEYAYMWALEYELL